MTKKVLGVDAGGTKTLAVIADDEGRVLGIGRAGSGNFQGGNPKQAGGEVRKAVEGTLASAGLVPDQVNAAFYGMAGADRPADFQIVEDMLREANPVERWGFENDAVIVLRSGARDGVGIGVICGTGTNVVGFNARGERVQVGGLGYMFGDTGGASHIATLGIRHAVRGNDGRGKSTILYEKFTTGLGLANLDDLVGLYYEGSPSPPNISSFASLVFESADEGDAVAIEILTHVGREMGNAARAALRRLFDPADDVSVVMGGGVFKRAANPTMHNAFRDDVLSEYPRARLIVPELEPVFGALFFAFDRVGVPVTDELAARLGESSKRVVPGCACENQKLLRPFELGPTQRI